MAREIVETLVRVFGQPQAGEEARRFLGLLRQAMPFFLWPLFRWPILAVAAAFGLAQRLEIHFAIGGVR